CVCFFSRLDLCYLPTRRSSDLRPSVLKAELAPVARVELNPVLVAETPVAIISADVVIAHPARGDIATSAEMIATVVSATSTGLRDRKSTRLNSRHVSNSQADSG